MRNIDATVSGNILTIKVDLSIQGEPSSSGKSLVIGSTEGNVPVPGRPEIKIGVNVYVRKE